MDRKIQIPQYVQGVMTDLNANGFEAFVVGGCVRDSLMGRRPCDWDLCTDATPDRVKEIFGRNAVPTGEKHGTVTVLSDNMPIEVTTYRTEGKYSDNRRPDSVDYVKNISEDLKRRDFTVNAMAYNKEKGLLDLFGGAEDIKNRVIRCVGDPRLRFTEDALRILRALRFASVCGFSIEQNTADALAELAPMLKNIATERIYAELKKLLSGDKPSEILISYRQVFAVFMGECFGNSFDPDWCRTADLLPNDYILRLGAVSMMCDGDLCEMLCRLKTEKKTRSIICAVCNRTDIPKSQRDVLQLIRKIGADRARAMAEINSAYEKTGGGGAWQDALKIIKEVTAENMCATVGQLDITGERLAELGYRGAEIGKALEDLLDLVIDGRCENNQAELEKYLS